jgi:hypothetical protein
VRRYTQSCLQFLFILALRCNSSGPLSSDLSYKRETKARQVQCICPYVHFTTIRLRARKRTRPKILLLRRHMGTDIKVEDIHRHTHSSARVGNLEKKRSAMPADRSNLTYINYTCNVSLHRRTRQQEVDLIIAVSYNQSQHPSSQVPVGILPYLLRYSITLKHVCRYAIVVSR